MQYTSVEKKKSFRIIKRIFLGGAIILFILFCVFAVAGLKLQKISMTPSGYKQMQSVYVTMKDGIKIAVRVILPYGLKANERIPAVMESTRYSTGYQLSFVGNALVNLGILEDDTPVIVKQLLKSNYVYIYVQARGSGVSFGKRDIEWSIP